LHRLSRCAAPFGAWSTAICVNAASHGRVKRLSRSPIFCLHDLQKKANRKPTADRRTRPELGEEQMRIRPA
jgi:hypothetical protein